MARGWCALIGCFGGECVWYFLFFLEGGGSGLGTVGEV